MAWPVAHAQILINEIHYAPDVKTEPAEFIELYNAGTNSVDLTGWYFSDGIQYRFTNSLSVPVGGFLVVAQDPATILNKYGAVALGPWTGSLANEGEKIVLRNAAGQVMDEVNYQLGFPWPTVGDPPGYSVELVNPGLDNDLGGNWRVSVAGGDPGQQQTEVLLPAGSPWKYFKGWSEASDPTTAWRTAGFDDSAWPEGLTPVGYGEPNITILTPLDDMLGNYTTVFFRSTFVVTNVAELADLTLEVMYDDGFKIWLNGEAHPNALLSINMTAGEVPFNATAGTAREDYTYNVFALPSPAQCLVEGTNVIAIQAANSSLTTSSDFFLDVRLTTTRGTGGGAARGPTPGARNAAFASNLPPAIRQVEHQPKQPTSGVPVLISAKVTDPDGVASVALQYQVVDPGNYIELTDAAYTNNWTAVAMNDAGLNGDAAAGDSVFSVELPSSLQIHRRLVRYRITAVDRGGRTLTVPYADDPQPNFAYFVYNGVPAWTGAVRPGAAGALGQVFTVGTNEMNRLPVYHLLAKKTAVEDATWLSHYWGDAYPWAGTLVYDGEVYDHIHYRARGGCWRYSMCKNMWKFALNTGHEFQARDDWGRRYQTRWTKLNLGASIQQGDYNHRGEQGMFESVGFRLFNLAGVETCKTTFAQLRIVDEPAEINANNQWEGDFWGVYLAVEQEGGRFLDEHDLPDGNFYKMEGGSGELSNLGPNGPTDKSDLNAFLGGLNGGTSDDWWRANWYLPNGYGYQAIVQAIHHFDIGGGKNYFYYRNPLTGIWTVHAWDLDLTWAENMYDAGGYGGEAFKSYALPRPAFNLEYRNRVREIRDLLFNLDQTGQLIDEYAGRLRGPTNTPSILDADRSQWDYNPRMIDPLYTENPGSKAGQGRFYRWPNEPTVSKDFNGCLQLMKNYVLFRSTNTAAQGGPLDRLAADTLIPNTPTASYVGPMNYPVNRLVFRTSPFSGVGGFASLKWRIGEITRPTVPSWAETDPWHYEIEPVWESGELTGSPQDITVPAGVLKVGHVYRARVQMKDLTGRTSHWSPAVQFVATEPDNAAALIDHLRVTEVMYDPPAGSEFEFIELLNTSTNLGLTLDGAKFTTGIDFVFPSNTVVAPGGYVVLARTTNVPAFRAQYGLAPDVPVIGGYAGSLANQGEQVELKTSAAGTELASFQYGGRGWPVAADGGGHSLVVLDRALTGQATGSLDYPGNWRASAYRGGSPGRADPVASDPVVVNEVVAHTDYLTALDSNDWLELYNRADAARQLGPNWYLSDDPANLKKWMIPPATLLPARGRVTFDEVSGFHYPTNTGFGLNKSGDQVLLSYLPGTAEDRVVDAVRFKGQENDYSWERYPDGGEFWYPAARSSNTVNRVPTPSVVISEIMYHPLSLDGTNDNTLDEYVQLLNPTASATNLFSTDGSWRIDGGVSFTLPPNTTLPAGGCLLVVNFDPAVGTNLAHFRAFYGLTNTAIPIVGPYGGKLGNRSDRVALEKPQFPDWAGDPYSWVIADEVIYGNQNPWPTSPNGTGFALRRLSISQSGNDPANWVAVDPNPGGGTVNPDRDNDGMPNVWEELYNLNPDDPSDAAADADGDGLTNLQEYLAGTDPRDPTSVLRFESVDATPTGTALTFRAAANRSYTIQFRDSFSAGAWQKLRDVAADAAPRSLTLEDIVPANTPERYYRLVAPATP